MIMPFSSLISWRRDPQNPGVGVNRVFGAGDPLIIEGGAIAIYDDTVIGVSSFIAVIVIGELGLQTAGCSLAQLRDDLTVPLGWA